VIFLKFIISLVSGLFYYSLRAPKDLATPLHKTYKEGNLVKNVIFLKFIISLVSGLFDYSLRAPKDLATPLHETYFFSCRVIRGLSTVEFPQILNLFRHHNMRVIGRRYCALFYITVGLFTKTVVKMCNCNHIVYLCPQNDSYNKRFITNTTAFWPVSH
jgi:hypothetical protein